jgi:hypothetical protein
MTDPNPISLELMNSSIMPPACRCRRIATTGAREQSRGHSAHIGAEVVIHYRWHPLHGRRLRRHYSERRAIGEVVHVEVSPGVVTIVPGWMLDPVVCARMGFGAPRVAVSALAELHDLLTNLGFRQSSATDVAEETRHEAVLTPPNPSLAPAESLTRNSSCWVRCEMAAAWWWRTMCRRLGRPCGEVRAWSRTSSWSSGLGRVARVGYAL